MSCCLPFFESELFSLFSVLFVVLFLSPVKSWIGWQSQKLYYLYTYIIFSLPTLSFCISEKHSFFSKTVKVVKVEVCMYPTNFTMQWGRSFFILTSLTFSLSLSPCLSPCPLSFPLHFFGSFPGRMTLDLKHTDTGTEYIQWALLVLMPNITALYTVHSIHMYVSLKKYHLFIAPCTLSLLLPFSFFYTIISCSLFHTFRLIHSAKRNCNGHTKAPNVQQNLMQRKRT